MREKLAKVKKAEEEKSLTVKWEKPKAFDLRLGFEVTMYVSTIPLDK